MGKKEYLRMEMGAGSMQLMALLKTSLDPEGILNPGKVLDVEQAITADVVHK